jgi:exodeoxyribonuclease X
VSVTIYSDKLTRFRVLDLETTGTSPDDAVVEIAAVDLVGREVVIIGSDLRPKGCRDLPLGAPRP